LAEIYEDELSRIIESDIQKSINRRTQDKLPKAPEFLLPTPQVEEPVEEKPYEIKGALHQMLDILKQTEREMSQHNVKPRTEPTLAQEIEQTLI
jgi:hypothetical protein